MSAKVRLLKHGVWLLSLAFLAGCTAVPMSYREWQEEQERRRTAEATGIPFKSKRQLLVEGEELKRIAAEIKFP